MSAIVTSLLETNLSAHRARWGFAPEPGPGVDESSVRVEPTEGPWSRVSLRVADGRWLRVHSDRQPLVEAARWLDETRGDSAAASLVCLVGAGYGYALDVLESQSAATLKILVIEPEPAFLRLCLGRRDWTPLIEAGRLMVLAAPAYEGKTEAWRMVAPDAPDPPIVSHPVIAGAREVAAKEAIRIAAQAVAGARANDEARRLLAPRYVLNTLRNLAHVAGGADPALLRGRFAGVPAVVVGAGPSLNATLPALREVEDRALVISTDTAWRPLAAAGIDPAFVVATDPTELNGRHLLGVECRREPWLIAEGSVDPRALQALAGRVATFKVADHHPWPWLQTVGIERPLVRVWGSVLTAAFDLALTFGCDPIVFIGADLAYTDGRPYCRGTAFEFDWAAATASGPSLRQLWRDWLSSQPVVMAPDIHQREVATAPRLLEFRNWLVARTTEQPARRFINATGAGTLWGGRVEQLDLHAALQSQPRRDSAIHDGIRRWLHPAADSAVQRVADAAAAAAAAAIARVGDSPTGPLADWLAFGRPSLTRDEIHAALVQGQQALVASRASETVAHDRERTVAHASPLRLPVADRAARMHALIVGSDAGLDGIVEDLPELSGRSTESLRADTTRILSELCTLRAWTNGSSPHASHAWMPLSWRFSWTGDAAPLVAQLEESLIALATALTEAERTTAFRRSDTVWSGPVLPVRDTDPLPVEHHRPTDDEAIAQSALMCVSLDVSASEEESPQATAAERRDRRLLRAMARGLSTSHPHEPADAYVPVTLHGSPWAPRPLRIDAYMRGLTGTLAVPGARTRSATLDACRVSLTVPEPPGGVATHAEPRLVFVTHPVAVVEPEVLSHGGLARWICGDARSDVATLAPLNQRRSLRIAEDGHSEPGTEWPVAITGEVPWGGDGALAWNEFESTLLLRAQNDAAPLIETVPFRPRAVAVDGDGEPVWLAANGGLWSWRPGQSGRQLIDTPECTNLYLHDEVLWLTPLVRDAKGLFVRRRALDRLFFDRGRHVLGHQACGPAGQEITIAARGGWTARTYLYSDAIGLTHVDGRSVALACYAPYRAAWSGRSLIVTTLDAAVLFFRDLIGHLDQPAWP